MNSANLSQGIGTSPGVYGILSDAPPIPGTPPRSVPAFPVETLRGRRGPAKVSSAEDFRAEYGHDPRFSLTTYGPLLSLRESSRVVVTRVLRNAKESGAMLCVIPHDAATPEGMGGVTVLRPFIVGSENAEKGIRMSDDFVLAFYDRSPGKSEKRLRLVPEINNPDGGFHVEVYLGNSTDYVERFHVKMTDYQNGYGEQMHIEQVINFRSRQIGVILNENVQGTIYLGDNLVDRTMEVWLNGGDNGDRVIASDVVSTMISDFGDPERIRFNTIAAPGFEIPEVQRAQVAIAQARKGAFACLGVPFSQQDVDAARVYRNKSLNIDSSYGALYTGDPIVVDPYTKRNTRVPVAALATALYCYTDYAHHSFFSPAGRKRGDMQRFDTIGPARQSYSQADRDVLFASQVNPVKTLDEVGSFVWGDSTLQRRQSLTSMVGVCRHRATFYLAIVEILDNNVFDPYDDFLRDAIDSVCKDILKEDEKLGAVTGIATKFDTAKNTARAKDAGDLYYKISYTPKSSLRRLVIDFTLNNSGVDVAVSA